MATNCEQVIFQSLGKLPSRPQAETSEARSVKVLSTRADSQCDVGRTLFCCAPEFVSNFMPRLPTCSVLELPECELSLVAIGLPATDERAAVSDDDVTDELCILGELACCPSTGDLVSSSSLFGLLHTSCIVILNYLD